MKFMGTSSGLCGSATVEAALIFPVIIFFFLSIIWIMDLFLIHARVESVLNTAGSEMVAYSYPYNVLTDGDDQDNKTNAASLAFKVGWNEFYIKEKILKLPEAERIKEITTLLSDVSKEDEIDIVVTYRVKPYIEIPGLTGVILTNHFYSKAYVGYDRKDTVSEEMVYITRNGTVYHTSLDCRSLNITPNAIGKASLDTARNNDGSKYYPCEYCSKNGFGDVIYVTPYGNRYHSTLSCSQLKPEIFQVPLSEVGGRSKCKFCIKEGH